jgi:hypothetical protein
MGRPEPDHPATCRRANVDLDLKSRSGNVDVSLRGLLRLLLERLQHMNGIGQRHNARSAADNLHGADCSAFLTSVIRFSSRQ